MSDTLLESITSYVNNLNLDSLRRTIENNLQANGRLPVSLDNFPFGNILTYLLGCYQYTKPNADQVNRIRDMINYLIMIRDRDNNLLFDINLIAPNNNGTNTNIIDQCIKVQLPIAYKRAILLRLFGLININNGKHLLAPAPDGGSEALKSAIELADIPILQVLFHARTENGDYIIDLSRASTTGYLDSDCAIQDVEKKEQVAIVLKGALIDRGLLIAPDDLGMGSEPVLFLNRQIRAETEYRKRPNQRNQAAAVPPQRPVVQQAPEAGQQAARFAEDTQNTHNPTVTNTIGSSLAALNRRYAHQINEDAAVREIEQLCEQFDYDSITVNANFSSDNKKEYAKDFLELIKKRFQVTHSHTGLTYKRILTLIWHGIIDKNIEAYPVDMHKNIRDGELDNLIKLKKASMIEKFIEATLTYRNNHGGGAFTICVGGGIHKLLEIINRAHVDVVIATGQQSVRPLANEMAISLVGIELLKKEIDEQNNILKTWNIDESIGAKFKQAVITTVSKQLKHHFGALLSQEDIDGITAAIEYIPRPPVPSAELNKKIDEIEGISPTGTSEKKAAVEMFKERARTVYSLNLSTKQKIASLQYLQHTFDEFDDLVQKLLNIENNYQGNTLRRLESIDNIKRWIQVCYKDYQNGESAENCKKKLTKRISQLCKDVHRDHKKHGRLRFFGYLQPRSRLVTHIDKVLHDTDPRVIVSRIFKTNEIPYIPRT